MRIFSFLLSLALLAITSFAQSGDPLPYDSNPLYTATVPANGTNEVQTITIGGTPTAGTFTLAFRGRTTAAITWSATNATLIANIDAALEALPTVGTGGVTTAVGSMTAGIGTATVTFAGNLAKLAVPTMTYVSSLTGTSPTLGVAETTPGVTADGRTQARKGTLCVDKGTPALYQNTSSIVLQPTWTKISP